MLSSLNLSDKTYEELLAEAIAQIPLYSREWTNYNVSDPGITMLQNMTAFQLLQQEEINSVPEEIWRKLLKLVGYTGRDNHAATVLVQAPAGGGPILPAGYQLWSGSLSFETTESVPLMPWGLQAVYAVEGSHYRDVTQLLNPASDSVAYPFGKQPAADMSMLFVLSGTPELGVPLRLWLQIAEEELRTPFGSKADIPDFSRLKWQYYTEKGWKDAQMEDETIGLLRSGQVTLTLDQGDPVRWTETPIQGCAIRCLLARADYDRVPRLRSVACHLFPMVQKLSSIQCITAAADHVLLQSTLARKDIHQVFCKETADGPYVEYRLSPDGPMPGRFYTQEETPLGVRLHFDRGPCTAMDAVRVVCYDEDMVHHRLLGPVYSYDHQVIQLDLVQDVLKEDLLVALMTEDEEGETFYRFVRPEEEGPDGFRYHLRSHAAQLVVDNPGLGGCELLLAGCSTTQGSRGNLRPGTALEKRGGYDGTDVEARFRCPTPGRGGVTYESTEELRLRFSAGMRETAVAVRAEDYETLVRQTPGLCIHKVKAVAVAQKNLVKITVKPHTEDPLPQLSKEYLNQIRQFLDPRRMLTTRFELCQPRYVPISVHATLSIRGISAQVTEEVEALLRKLLDYVNGPQNFGEWIRFNDIYQKLSALPSVEGVDALNLFPETRDAALVGSDIRLEDDSLCYPGTIRLSFRERGR